MVKNKVFWFFQINILFILFLEFNAGPITMNYPGTYKKEFKGGKNGYFQVNFKDKIQNKLLRIYVENKGMNINPEVIMSTSIQEPNRANATLFVEEPFGDVFMYVPKELIDVVFYLNISCYSNDCPVTVILSETNEVNISRDSQHSFLSNPPKVERRYYVHRANTKDGEYVDQNATMTLFVIGPPKSMEIKFNYLRPNEKGNKNVTTEIQGVEIENGYIVSFNEEKYEYDEKGLYEIVVKSREISYITVGSRSTVEGFYTRANHIFPNKRGTFGYFDTTILSGECYRITIPYRIDKKIKPEDYNFYANYIVFSETAEVYFLNQTTGKEIESKTKSIEGELGVIVTMDDVENNVICIRPSGGKTSVLYYLELNDYNVGRSNSIYSPQISGRIYTRYLPINSHLFFTHKEAKDKEINYNVKTLQGITKSYYVYCESYPSCLFNDYTELDKEIENGNQNFALLKGTHNMVTFSSTFKEEESLISSKQHLLLVFCLNSTMCKFETSFYSENTYMNLKPDDIYFQHLKEKDNNLFRLHFYKKFQTIEKLTFSLTTFNGNLNIELLAGHENYEKQYHFAGNKQIIIFTPINDKSDDIELKIKCNYNSFYSIEYSMLSTDKEITKFIDEGASIIQTIYGQIGQAKIFKMRNNRKDEEAHYVVDFYSLNCKLRVNRGGTIINTENNFSQDLILPDMEYYSNDIYEYTLTVMEMGNTINEDPFCLVQISNFEMDSNNISGDFKERSITIPAEYDVQINLEKNIPSIKLLYPHSNSNDDVHFDFILEQELEIKIKFAIESYELSNYIISRRQLITITKKDISTTGVCTTKGSLCCISIYISADIPKDIDKVNVRVNAKTKNNDPTFIKRGEIKKDTLIEDQLSYYYTEINKNEVGYITVNFNRASGEVFAKILNIDDTEEKLDTGDKRFWLGKYNLPTEREEKDLDYNPFTKNLHYDSEQTSKCRKACFALLVVKSTVKKDKNSKIPKSYDISIAVHEDEEYTLNERSIDIPVNEFIIGSISSQDQLINYFQYYTFDVLTDSEKIYIDINSDSCNLYVRIGENKPTIRTADFTFTSNGEESVYEINVNHTLFKEKNITTLKGQRFTFAIGTTYADTLYTTLYAFRLRAPKKDKFDLINMNTDQVGLCKIEENDYCYFLINVKGEEKSVNEVLMHAFSADKTKLTLFVNILDSTILNSGDNDLIQQYLPTKDNAHFKSTDNYISDYLRFNVEKFEKNFTQAYILAGVHAENSTVVNFISTFYKYIDVFKANSFTKQIFLLLKKQQVVLEFPQNLNLIIKIISIYGEGELFYQNEDDSNDKHYLHGSGDAISFMQKNKNIVVRSFSEEEFGFYVIYNLRPEENYDDINYGSSALFNLEKDLNEKIDFPLIYYTKLNNNNQPVDFNIKILDLDYDKDKNGTFEKDTNDFQILGVVTSKNIVLGKKMNQYVNPDMSDAKYGSFDQALKLGKVHFSAEDIEKFINNEKEEGRGNEDKYLYVTISKSPSNKHEYRKIASDISILPSNNIKYKSYIRQYNFGNILADGNNKYNLVSDNPKATVMKIEFAQNNKNIDFSITSPDETDIKKNMTFIKSEYSYGRSIIIVEIKNIKNVYLNVFLKDNKSKIDNEKLNIVFKYNVYEKQEQSEEGNSLKQANIEYEFNEPTTLKLKVQPMQRDNQNIDALYSVRVIPQDNAHEEEILDSVSLYQFENEYIYNKEVKSDVDEIEIVINDFPSKKALYYVAVFATALDTKESLAYELITIGGKNNGSHPEVSGKFRVMMFILFGAIGVLVLVLVIVIIRMKKQNAALEDEVEVLKINFDDDSDKNKNKGKGNKVSLLGKEDE